MPADLLTHVLRQGDRAMVLCQRLGQWIAHAPEFEEDVALANISLDLLGQARHLYTYAGALEGRGRLEDDFAYTRDADEFFNPLLVEQPNGDFAVTMVRQYLHDQWAMLYWEAMIGSQDATLSALAARAKNETAFHLRHSTSWVVRLGDGTDESHRRTQSAIDQLWPHTDELTHAADETQLKDAGLVVPVSPIEWRANVDRTFAEATLTAPEDADQITGGINGNHSPQLIEMLTEMQQLARAHPGVVW